MKDKVFMSPNNAELAIGIPLFRRYYSHDLDNKYGIIVCAVDDKPIAYAIDCGPEVEMIQCLNAEFVENQLECLGAL